jgi:transcriptional regulator with XRE-family HTH domain
LNAAGRLDAGADGFARFAGGFAGEFVVSDGGDLDAVEQRAADALAVTLDGDGPTAALAAGIARVAAGAWVALPFCYVRLKGEKPKAMAYPKDVVSIGNAIRARRLDLGLLQKTVAEVIGCENLTIVNWEKNHTKPRINHMAGVVKFLGFDPFPKGDTLAQRLVNHRKALGVAQKDFAGQLGVDPSSLARWERGERSPKGRFLKAVALVIEGFQQLPKGVRA